MARRFLALIAMLASGFGALVLGVRELRAARHSLTWPSVPAVIERSAASTGDTCVAYSYQVAGEAYTATTVFFGEESTTTNGKRASCNNDVILRYPVGAKIVARVDPSNPAYAVLEPGPKIDSYFPIAAGLLFLGGGGLWLWKEALAIWSRRRMWTARRDQDVPHTGRSVDLLSLPLLTPSEVVAIHGAEFASTTIGDTVRLVDGRKVSAQQLVIAELAAAILANEQAGTMRLALSDAAGPRLDIVATGATFSWPTPSVESRLQLSVSGRDEAAAIVRRWLGHPSQLGWQRPAEKVHVALVLRQLATVSQHGRSRKYALVDGPARAAAADGLAIVKELLERCKSERPAVWQLLIDAIVAAVEGSTKHPADLLAAYAAVDPWYDEAASDLRSVPGLTLFGDVKATRRDVVVWATIFWSALAAAVYLSGPLGRTALAIGLVASMLLVAAAVVWRRTWIDAVARTWPKLRLPLETTSERGWRQSAVIVVPLAALIIASSIALADNLIMVSGIAAGIAIAAIWLVRSMAREAITRQVADAAHANSNASDSGVDVETPRPDVRPLASALPLDVIIIKPSDLPEPSEHSRARIAAIRRRGAEVRRLYRNSVLAIAIASLVVSLLAWWLLSEQTNANTFPWFTAVLTALSLLVSSNARFESTIIPAFLIVRYALRYLRGGASLDRIRWEREITPIRPLVAPLLQRSWLVFTLVRGLTYLSGPSPANWALMALSVAVAAAAAVHLRRGRRALELQYPVYSPLNLVTLRVFGNTTRFIELLDLWHWFGPLYRLDGPDTAGTKTSDVVAYVTGRIDQAIVEDANELHDALRNFSRTRDSQLRYAFNSLQCNDRTWKDALDRVLERADVVVMDLSGFTAKNQGCAYELGRLVKDGPLERVVLLVDDETDVDCLRQLLSEVTADQARASAPYRFRLFHLGTQPIRRENESVYEWQRRATSPIDADRLVGLLCDVACAHRPPPDPIRIPWTRPAYRSAPVG